MKKYISIIIILIVLIIILLILPNIEYKYKDKLIKFSYSEDYGDFESNPCYSESYFYNEKWNISLYNFEVKKVLFFFVQSFSYKEGNICAKEYLLEEEYIHNFLDNAVIKENNKNIDLGKIIKNRKAIVGNKRYFDNDYETAIYYVLDGKEEVMYIYYLDNLLVIQVGLSDEGPKFIAYE